MSNRDRRRDTIVEHYPLVEGQQQIEIQRVVVISIDPNSAKYVVDWAVDNFIQPSKDLVVLVHVRLLEMPMAPYADSAGYMDDAAEERKTESHDLLKEYASGLWHKQISCKAVSMIGDPKAEIIRKVQETHADVLIMGSRNMGTIRRTLLGSVSDHCVHHAPSTVIIAKPPVEREEEGNKETRRRSFLQRIRSSS
ncbi:adenine nucleotide alpha hydrolases-like protein [Lichtheimia hyalospora FSU 10163]|nr:adenine nucleotide alpha hydrolases-like protein [Lichtheimia hyalospora FSU 10163]